MNTIHSSSLAFYPVGYNQPQAGRLDANREQKPAAEDGVALQNPQNQDSRPPSSTAQIQAALAENDLTVDNSNQATNPRTLKALNAYTENRNQFAQQRVSEMISGIDTYA